LRHILRRALAWTDDSGARYLTRYPLEGWKPLQESPGRTRFLDNDEITRVLAACSLSRSRYLTPFVLVALNTGCRRGEILSLTRKSIDWQNHIATIAQTKNGTAGHVPLNATRTRRGSVIDFRICSGGTMS
jgi:integrase